MRRWLALTSSVLTGLVVLAAVGVATGAPAQLVQILYGTSVVSNSNPLAVDCVSGCSGGGGVGDVNITEVGGNPVTTTVPVSGTVAATQSGGWTVGVTGALPAGNNNIGDVDALQSGTWTVQPGNTANTTPWLTSIAEGGQTAQVTTTDGGSLQVECTAGCAGGGGGGGTSSDFGDPMPTAGTAAGFQDAGGDMAPIVLEADGSLPVTVGAALPAGTNNIGDVDIASGSVTVDNAGGGSAVNIQDGGNTITVDGSVSATVSGTVAATQSGTWVLGANSGVDIGDVTVNNGSGGSAVNIQDGGNTITVDGSVTVSDGSGALNVIVDSGTVAATQSGTWNIGTVTPGTAASNLGKAEDAAAGNNDTGVATWNVRRDTAAASGANGDYVESISDSVGRTWVTGTGATAAAVPGNVTAMGAGTDGGLAAGTAALTSLITCNSSVAISTASSGNTQLVALTTSETIYVCGYNFIASGDVDVQLIYGTGSACATGETDLTGAYDLTTNGGISVSSPFWLGMAGAVSNALCIELSGAVQVSGVLFYTKF